MWVPFALNNYTAFKYNSKIDLYYASATYIPTICFYVNMFFSSTDPQNNKKKLHLFQLSCLNQLVKYIFFV